MISIKNEQNEKQLVVSPRLRIRQKKFNSDFLKSIRKAGRVFVWSNIFQTHGTYVEAVKKDVLKIYRLPLKHDAAPAGYHIKNDNLFLS